MKTFTLSISILLTLAFTAPNKETIFIGKVTTDSDNKDLIYGITVEFRIDKTVIARTKTDTVGSFKMSLATSKEFDIYFCGIGIRETYVQPVPPTDKDSVFMVFKVPKDYKKQFWKVYCPKCKKHDQTIPIRYSSNGIVVIQKIDRNGDTIRTNYDRKNYYGGGDGCIFSEIDPKYYCKRDKIKF